MNGGKRAYEDNRGEEVSEGEKVEHSGGRGGGKRRKGDYGEV